VWGRPPVPDAVLARHASGGSGKYLEAVPADGPAAVDAPAVAAVTDAVERQVDLAQCVPRRVVEDGGDLAAGGVAIASAGSGQLGQLVEAEAALLLQRRLERGEVGVGQFRDGGGRRPAGDHLSAPSVGSGVG
jgi:hypothetical protein